MTKKTIGLITAAWLSALSAQALDVAPLREMSAPLSAPTPQAAASVRAALALPMASVIAPLPPSVLITPSAPMPALAEAAAPQIILALPAADPGAADNDGALGAGVVLFDQGRAAPKSDFVDAPRPTLWQRAKSWLRASADTPLASIAKAIEQGRFIAAAAELETLSKKDDYVENAEAISELSLLLRKKRFESYDSGDAALQPRGRTLPATAKQEGGTCLLHSVDNAVRSAQGYAAPADAGRIFHLPRDVSEAVFSEPGVGDKNVSGLLRALGIPHKTIIQKDFPASPKEFAGKPMLASLSLPQDTSAGLGEWRHIVFVREVFKNKKGSWIAEVQDSEKGKTEYYSWERLRNLAASLHVLRIDKPVAVPKTATP